MKVFNPVTLLMILAGGAMIGFAMWRDEPGGQPAPPAGVAVNYQIADRPLEWREGAGFRFHQFSPWQRAMIPRAVRFDWPMGIESGGLTYNAQRFGEPSDARGGPHSGDDINGIGGMNTDLGDPVFAVADGLVVFTAEPDPSWGNVIILAHRDRDDRILTSLYAHLDRIEVPFGALVSRGQRIGGVGTAGGRYPAHLHFEMSTASGVDIGRAYGRSLLHHLDPSATLDELRGAPPDQLAPAILPLVLEKDAAWNRLEMKGAEILGELRER